MLDYSHTIPLSKSYSSGVQESLQVKKPNAGHLRTHFRKSLQAEVTCRACVRLVPLALRWLSAGGPSERTGSIKDVELAGLELRGC